MRNIHDGLRREAIVVAVAGITGLAAAAAPAVAKPPSASRVYIVQGVQGVSTDVSIDGKPVRSGMSTRDVAGPVHLSRSTHKVSFRSASWTVSSTFDATARSIDVVLHWPAASAARPEVTVFRNAVGAVPSGKGRLTIAHTAVAPPADLRVQGKVLFSNIANGEFVTAVVPAMTYRVDIVPTGGTKPLFGPVHLRVRAGALTRLFTIGMPTHGGMNAVVQVLPLRQRPMPSPESVHAGSAGLVAPGAGDRGAGALAAALVAAGALVVGSLTLLRRRAHR